MKLKFYFLIILFFLFSIFVHCSYNKIEKKTIRIPFSTSEWRECFEKCKKSIPITIEKSKFNETGINKINRDRLCVEECRKTLYKERGINLQ